MRTKTAGPCALHFEAERSFIHHCATPKSYAGAIARRRRVIPSPRCSPASAYGWPGPVNWLKPILVRQVLPEAYMPEKPKPGVETFPPSPAL